MASLQALILAGGEGSRLRADGVADPKPWVRIGARPYIATLIETLLTVGCESVSCLIRADEPRVLGELREGFPANRCFVHACHTPSSLHTLAIGLGVTPPGPVFCTMVDTVMRPPDWAYVHRSVESLLGEGADAVLAVTPYAEGDGALYVDRDPSGWVRALGETPFGTPIVTGGVYGLSPGVRALAACAVAEGRSRMRSFLRMLKERGLRVTTIEVEKIVDLDRASDLIAARDLLAQWENGRS